MLIEQEISGDIEQLIRLFKDSPQKTEKAIQRALAKVSRWAERQVLRDLSRQMNIPQKQLKALNRVVVRRTKTPGEKRYLSVWIGTNPVGAHRFGTPDKLAKVSGLASVSGAVLFCCNHTILTRRWYFSVKQIGSTVTSNPDAPGAGCGWACHWKSKPYRSKRRLTHHCKNSVLHCWIALPICCTRN